MHVQQRRKDKNDQRTILCNISVPQDQLHRRDVRQKDKDAD